MTISAKMKIPSIQSGELMFNYRSDPQHYLDASMIAVAEPSTPVAVALRRASRQSVGAILVTEGDRPAWLIDGKALAQQVINLNVEAAERKEKWSAFDKPLGEFLPSGQWHEKLKNATYTLSPQRVPLLADQAVQASIPLGDNNAPRALYAVFDEERLAGLLFSHETFKAHASTAAPTYVCKRGHSNRDPDKGRCSVCPARLIKVA